VFFGGCGFGVREVVKGGAVLTLWCESSVCGVRYLRRVHVVHGDVEGFAMTLSAIDLLDMACGVAIVSAFCSGFAYQRGHREGMRNGIAVGRMAHAVDDAVKLDEVFGKRG